MFAHFLLAEGTGEAQMLAISLLGPAAQARAKKPPHAGLWVGGTSFSRSSKGLDKSARLDL
jgi:hypothetical protein